MYRDKKNILLTMNVNPDTIFTVNHDYLQFKDDDKHILWSILFQTNDDRELFIKEINDKCKINRINQEIPKATVQETVKKPVNTMENKAITKIDVLDGDNNNINIQEDDDADNDETNVTKANLLSRMAKMGKKLPKLNSKLFEHSDSSDVDTTPPARIPKQINPTHKTNNKLHTIKTMSQEIIPVASYNSTIASNSTNLMPYNTVQLQEQQYTTHLNTLLTENRLNNTETRMNISKLDTKIEKILDKIDLLNYNKNNNNNVMASNAQDKQDHEEQLLNIESLNLDLKRENRLLRLKIKDLEQINNDKYDNKSQHIQNELLLENNKLNEKLKSTENLQLEEKQMYELKLNELNDKLIAKDLDLQKCYLKLEQIEKSNTEMETNNQTFKNDLKEKIDLYNIAEAKIIELENALQEINKNQQEQEKQQKEITVELIKSTMNKLYQKLYDKIDNYDIDKLFTKPEVLNTIRLLLKQETNAALNQYQMQ